MGGNKISIHRLPRRTNRQHDFQRAVKKGSETKQTSHGFVAPGFVLVVRVSATWFYNSYTLIHRGRVTHICVRILTIIGSDNGLSPSRCQAIIWTNVEILSIRTFRTNISEILSEIHTIWLKKMFLKMPSTASMWLVFSCLFHWQWGNRVRRNRWLNAKVVFTIPVR